MHDKMLCFLSWDCQHLVELLVKKFLKWTGFVVAGIALVALLVASWVYLASEREFNRRYEVAESPPLVKRIAASG